jgi:hypothetical protein
LRKPKIQHATVICASSPSRSPNARPADLRLDRLPRRFCPVGRSRPHGRLRPWPAAWPFYCGGP